MDKNGEQRTRMKKTVAADQTERHARVCGLTGQSLASLQHLLYVGYHDPLHVLQLRVDAAQVPSRSAVNVRLLGFLDVCVWKGKHCNKRLKTGAGGSGNVIFVSLFYILYLKCLRRTLKWNQRST